MEKYFWDFWIGSSSTWNIVGTKLVFVNFILYRCFYNIFWWKCYHSNVHRNVGTGIYPLFNKKGNIATIIFYAGRCDPSCKRHIARCFVGAFWRSRYFSSVHGAVCMWFKVAIFFAGSNTLRFFFVVLWFLKSRVYFDRPQTKEQLKHNIRNEANNIPLDALTRTMDHFQKRLHAVRNVNGRHIEGRYGLNWDTVMKIHCFCKISVISSNEV